MKILCLTGLFPKEYEKTINENTKRGIQNAANKLQWGIVDGLSNQPDVETTIINSLYIGSYPKRYKKMFIPSFNFKHNGQQKGYNVGFVNLSFIKVVSRYYSLKKVIKKWFKSNKDGEIAVIAYAMTSPFVELLNYIKRKYPYVKCCLVVPDLPEYMNVSSNSKPVFSFLKKIQIRHFKRFLKPIDGYVLLTKYMSDWFDWKINYTVVEGISLKKEADLEEYNDSEKEKSILYAGIINKKYGVLDLVESFIKIGDPEWKLDLFGTGTALEEIKEISKNYDNIRIHGSVPNSDVLNYQKKASILINPRNDNNEFTKYSFPSKIIEYMGSGTPMIAYKLTGIPNEYSNYFFNVDLGKDGLLNCIKKVMSLPEEERKKMGEKALNFVIKEKNAIKQTEKIIKLINEL